MGVWGPSVELARAMKCRGPLKQVWAGGSQMLRAEERMEMELAPGWKLEHTPSGSLSLHGWFLFEGTQQESLSHPTFP